MPMQFTLIFFSNLLFLFVGLGCLWFIHVNEESEHQLWPLIMLIPAGVLFWAALHGFKNSTGFKKQSKTSKTVLVLTILTFVLGFLLILGMVWGLGQGLQGMQF